MLCWYRKQLLKYNHCSKDRFVPHKGFAVSGIEEKQKQENMSSSDRSKGEDYVWVASSVFCCELGSS